MVKLFQSPVLEIKSPLGWQNSEWVTMKTNKGLSAYLQLLAIYLTLSVGLSANQTASAETQSYTKVPTIREKVYKVLSRSQKAYQNNKPAEALSHLDKLKTSTTLNSYEKAMMFNQYGAIYFGLENISEAIASYESLLRQNNYPKALKLKTLYNLAQLYYNEKQYSQVINRLDKWFSLTDSPTEQAYALQAQAYYYLENHQQVVDSINKAIDITNGKKLNPKEQWMVLMQSSLEELGLEEHRLSILKWLVRLFPTKKYMLSLASAYATMEKQKEQLAIMELAYKKGHLDTERLQLSLTTLFYAQGAPYKGAKIMRKGMADGIIKTNSQNLNLLSNCLRASQEFEEALLPIKQSAKLSDNPETYFSLATTYYQLGRWQEASEAFTQALDKNLSRREQRAWLLLGQTYLQLHLFDEAITSFTRASTFKESKDIASRWVRYAEIEQKRYEILLDNEIGNQE